MIFGTSRIESALRSGEIRYDVLPECVEYHQFRVKGVHIDLQVGPHVWYTKKVEGLFDLNRDDPRSLYAYHDARTARNVLVSGQWFSAPPGKILLPPGVGVLLHSIQAVGSSVPHITSTLDGRSTVGRFFFEVHQTAGHGEPGFDGIWTFEGVNNTDTWYTLDVGSYIASILFEEVVGDPIMYPREGRYQSRSVLDWEPRMMMPKQGNLSG